MPPIQMDFPEDDDWLSKMAAKEDDPNADVAPAWPPVVPPSPEEDDLFGKWAVNDAPATPIDSDDLFGAWADETPSAIADEAGDDNPGYDAAYLEDEPNDNIFTSDMFANDLYLNQEADEATASAEWTEDEEGDDLFGNQASWLNSPEPPSAQEVEPLFESDWLSEIARDPSATEQETDQSLVEAGWPSQLPPQEETPPPAALPPPMTGRRAARQQLPAPEPAPPPEEDVLFDESWLNAFDGSPEARASGGDAPDMATPFTTDEMLPAETPDWLGDVIVDEMSATSVVRQRKDKSLDQLDNRLKRLRARAETMPGDGGAAAASRTSAGVSDDIAPASTAPSSATLIDGVMLTSDQASRVAMLRSLVEVTTGVINAQGAAQNPNRLSAIDLTYETPYVPPFADEGTEVVVKPDAPPSPKQKRVAPAGRVRRRLRSRWRPRVDRLLIILILGAAVLLPFYTPGLRIANLPPSSFAVGSSEQRAYEAVETLPPGSLVLVAMEYSPASSSELDSMTDALFRHILGQGAYPVVIGGNPATLLRAQTLFDAIADDEVYVRTVRGGLSVERDLDYFIVRFLPGGALGLRAFSENTAALLLTDIRGQALDLGVTTLRDFNGIVVIADRAEDVRAYAEQVSPLVQPEVGVVAAVSYAVAPLVEPYVEARVGGNSGLSGLLIGYADAYTYSRLIGQQMAQAATLQAGPVEMLPMLPETTETPTSGGEGTRPPTATPSDETGATPTDKALAPIDTGSLTRIPTSTPTLTPPATSTRAVPRLFTPSPSPTATYTPSNTPTFTYTPSPTLTPTITPSVTPTSLAQFATITGAQNVNVREGPSIGFGIIAVVAPRTRVEVIGYSEDRGWANVRLANGTVGYISTPLLQIEGAFRLPRDVVAKVFVLPQQEDVPPTRVRPTVSADDRTATFEAIDTATPTPSSTPTLLPDAADTATRIWENLTSTAQRAADLTETSTLRGTNTRTPRPTRTPAETVTSTATATATRRATLTDRTEEVEAATSEAVEPSPSPSRTTLPTATATMTRSLTQTAIPTRTATDTVTEEAQASATPESTPSVEPTATVTPTVATETPAPMLPQATPPPELNTLAYRDERWNAMTLGTIVSAGVILFGMVINLVRGLRRRRPR